MEASYCNQTKVWGSHSGDSPVMIIRGLSSPSNSCRVGVLTKNLLVTPLGSNGMQSILRIHQVLDHNGM